MTVRLVVYQCGVNQARSALPDESGHPLSCLADRLTIQKLQVSFHGACQGRAAVARLANMVLDERAPSAQVPFVHYP